MNLLHIVLLLLAIVAQCTITAAPIAVIGGGFSGLTAALEMKRLGHEVVLYEKSDVLGGRAHLLRSPDGKFTFDAGPSWYWMPDVFDRVFDRFDAKRSDLYNLTLLDPAYRVYLATNNASTGSGLSQDGSESIETIDVPGTFEGLKAWLHQRDPHNTLDEFFAEADEKYTKGVGDWIWRPMSSIVEMLDPALAWAAVTMNMFGSFETHLSTYTSDEVARTILKWPVIFVGASPAESPAMYSMLSYSGHAHGTWYPHSDGLSAPAFALERVARAHGIDIRLQSEVSRIVFDDPSSPNTAQAVCFMQRPDREHETDEELSGGSERCEQVKAIVAAGDYHHMEQVLLPPHVRRYDAHYWERQVLSPSCMLYYLGFDTKIPGLLHHTFFFDSDLEAHLRDVFVHHKSTSEPTFYVATTSKTDPSVAPEHGEAVFVLIPLSHRLNGTDDHLFREDLFQRVMARMEKQLGVDTLRSHLVYRKDYGMSDFEKEFYALRGNAFGLANLLTQSLIFKPAIDSLADNVVFAGHLTHPGPGVPPALVSGIVAAGVLHGKLTPPSAISVAIRVIAHTFLYVVAALIGLLVLAHLSVLVASLWMPMVRSYMLCIKLYYLHGRTYFAAGTLMRPRQFLDTAAMYALFRVADDCVDTPGRTSEEKRAELHTFQTAFWTCWRKGKADESVHPTLPAIVDAAIRRGYPESLFQRFFSAMEMDVGVNVCKDFDAVLAYMDGSAAVIGDFMVPILMGDKTDTEQKGALPHARDLGIAFQLTNMIRDIDEDLDLNRQYIPQDLCDKYGVDLRRRDHHDPAFRKLIDEMFARTDAFYRSADKGIALLPTNVQSVIKLARLMYHEIHTEIAHSGYRIFDGRVKVSFARKMAIATSEVPASQIARMVAIEIYAFILRTVWQYSAPLLSFCWAVLIMAVLGDSVPGCTYAHFHLLYTLPVMAFLLEMGRVRTSPTYFGATLFWTLVLCVVATVYTTPWDNLLVYLGIWGYSPNRVLFEIGWVPIEEYAFFTIETLMVGGLWLAVFPNFDALKDPPTSPIAATTTAYKEGKKRREKSSSSTNNISEGHLSVQRTRRNVLSRSGSMGATSGIHRAARMFVLGANISMGMSGASLAMVVRCSCAVPTCASADDLYWISVRVLEYDRPMGHYTRHLAH